MRVSLRVSLTKVNDLLKQKHKRVTKVSCEEPVELPDADNPVLKEIGSWFDGQCQSECLCITKKEDSNHESSEDDKDDDSKDDDSKGNEKDNPQGNAPWSQTTRNLKRKIEQP